MTTPISKQLSQLFATALQDRGPREFSSNSPDVLAEQAQNQGMSSVDFRALIGWTLALEDRTSHVPILAQQYAENTHLQFLQARHPKLTQDDKETFLFLDFLDNELAPETINALKSFYLAHKRNPEIRHALRDAFFTMARYSTNVTGSTPTPSSHLAPLLAVLDPNELAHPQGYALRYALLNFDQYFRLHIKVLPENTFVVHYMGEDHISSHIFADKPETLHTGLTQTLNDAKDVFKRVFDSEDGPQSLKIHIETNCYRGTLPSLKRGMLLERFPYEIKALRGIRVEQTKQAGRVINLGLITQARREQHPLVAGALSMTRRGKLF